MNIIAIVQARMGSTRLPGKMMLDLAGTPVIAHVIRRVRAARLVHGVWLATTVNAEDDVLADWAKNEKVPCYRGSVDDVLDRYYETAKLAGAETIVRVTGDCPLIDPEVIAGVVRAFQEHRVDYCSDVDPPTYPDGYDVEVFSFAALERAWREAKLKSEREHVTPYIRNHRELFTAKNVAHTPDLSSYRLTLDTSEDLVLIRNVAEACGKANTCGLDAVLGILTAHPDWQRINAKNRRNEGYQKSLKKDA